MSFGYLLIDELLAEYRAITVVCCRVSRLQL